MLTTCYTCYDLHLIKINSKQLNSIKLAFNHRYSLKGLNRPCVYDSPLTLAPQKKSPFISKEEILRRNAEGGLHPSRDDLECNGGHNN